MCRAYNNVIGLIRRKIMNLCKINIHSYTNTDAKYPNSTSKLVGIPSINATRTCKKCGKTQEQYIHCLGLNPPEYSYTWFTKHKE